MTYDELLTRIDGDLSITGYQFMGALRAVVELHKPQPTTIPSDLKCSACSGLDWCDYPCPTIQAIEKELS